MILALDISTRITGFAVIDFHGKVIEHGAWRFTSKKLKAPFAKVEAAQEHLQALADKYLFKQVFIEEIAKKFSFGKSSANTIVKLAQFNGTVAYLSYKIFGLEPQYIPATSARKLAGIRVPRGRKAKDVVIDYLLDNMPCFSVEYTKAGNIRPAYYDMADAIVLGLAGYSKICESN